MFFDLIDFLIKLWSNYKEIIIWGIIFIFGTEIIYKFGLKNDWQKLRKENGFVRNNDHTPPQSFGKNKLGKRIYFIPCIKLRFFSALISVAMCLLYTLQSPTHNFDTKYNISITIFSFIGLYSLFLDVSIKSENVIDRKNSKVFANLYAIISWIKIVILKSIITTERKRLCKLYVN